MIKYKYEELDFHVDSESGNLVIDYGENVVEIENHIAIELMGILMHKLHLHIEQKESVIKRFFK
jgi:hypothetical protein